MNTRIVGILMLMNCCFHLYKTGKRPFILEIRNVTCLAYTGLMKRIGCDAIKLGISRYSFNAMIQLSRQLPLDAELEVLLHYRVPHSKKVAKLINIRFKACNTFTALPLVPLLKNIIDKIAAHGNFPLTCPVRGNVMYNASNLIITDAILPSYMPIVQFNFTLNILNKGKAICHYLVQGSTTAKT